LKAGQTSFISTKRSENSNEEYKEAKKAKSFKRMPGKA